MSANNNKHLNLLNKVLSNQASYEEKQVLEQWIEQDKQNEAFIEETTEVWDLAGNYGEELPIDTTIAWNKFEARLNQQISEKPRESIVRFLLVHWKAAAVIGLICLAAIGVYNNGNNLEKITSTIAQVETGVKEQQEVRLPDGSIVVLNENSMLSYDENFQTRKVTLKGEAFFDVTKQAGEPFEIMTTTTKTTVLGTSFNVRAYENKNVEVAVLAGKVAVEKLGTEKGRVLLLPNQTVVYDVASGTMEKETAPNANAMAWKTQELVFKNSILSEVVEVLEQYFGVEIESNEKVLNCHYTGSFKNPDLEEVFNTIAFTFPTDLEIKKVDGKYILIGQGCE